MRWKGWASALVCVAACQTAPQLAKAGYEVEPGSLVRTYIPSEHPDIGLSYSINISSPELSVAAICKKPGYSGTIQIKIFSRLTVSTPSTIIGVIKTRASGIATQYGTGLSYCSSSVVPTPGFTAAGGVFSSDTPNSYFVPAAGTWRTYATQWNNATQAEVEFVFRANAGDVEGYAVAEAEVGWAVGSSGGGS